MAAYRPAARDGDITAHRMYLDVPRRDGIAMAGPTGRVPQPGAGGFAFLTAVVTGSLGGNHVPGERCFRALTL
jgi:hypothetical protein